MTQKGSSGIIALLLKEVPRGVNVQKPPVSKLCCHLFCSVQLLCCTPAVCRLISPPCWTADLPRLCLQHIHLHAPCLRLSARHRACLGDDRKGVPNNGCHQDVYYKWTRILSVSLAPEPGGLDLNAGSSAYELYQLGSDWYIGSTQYR